MQLLKSWFGGAARPAPAPSPAVAPQPTAAPPDPLPPGFIDVRERIRELSHDELLRGADHYFASLGIDAMQCKKPFSDAHQSIDHFLHLSLLMRAADLFPGARVLEFGCATGWLSIGMAQMGCDVVGVDIAPSALRLAEQLRDMRLRPNDGQVEFRVYDGEALPAPDASFDRVVCFDAFHHVRDQAFVIREIARVLRPGGRAAFVEPGPLHSRTEQSQSEMRLYKVIENDVSMTEVSRYALAAGLEAPRMLVHLPQPLEAPADAVQGWAAGGLAPDAAQKLLRDVQEALTNTQVFHLGKGPERKDSRRIESLAADIELLSQRRDAATGRGAFEVLVRNTGQGRWLSQGTRGVVRLGCQLWTDAGEVVTQDYYRFDLPRDLEPGQECIILAEVALPPEPGRVLRFDLVSELLAWFAMLGGQPLSVPVAGVPPAAAGEAGP